MRKRVWICCILCVFLVSTVLAQESAVDSVAKYMALGDKLVDAWDHDGALAAYMKVLEYDAENYEATWKAGDQYTEVADRLEHKHLKESYFEQAVALCEKATELKPDGFEGHFRLSVALGRLALFRGGKKKIEMSKVIKAEADKALELNPESDLTHHVLGRWHQNLANLSGVLKFFAGVFFGGVPPGTNEEAVEHFNEAIALDPAHIEHHLELGRTYQFMKEKDLARASLEQVLALPSIDEDDPEFKEEAEKMIKKLK
jgi:tetratricopeptide (TPR) repeat protein